MPSYKISLPDGREFNVDSPTELTDAQAWQAVQAEASKPSTAKGGFKAALSAGIDNLQGSAYALAGRTGLMDADKAAEGIARNKREAEATFKPTEDGWTESPWTKFKETLGGSLPYMAAPVVAGGAASLALPAGAIGALGAAGAAGLASAAQFTGTNLDRQMDEGKSLQDTNLGAAAAAAVPQAALDMIGLGKIPGVRQVVGLIAKDVGKEAAVKIAGQTTKQVLADYAKHTAGAIGTEGITEAGQQVLERLQAGLSITDPAARKEYWDSFLGGAVLGGVMAPGGRYMERGRIAEKQAEQAKADKAAAAEAAKKAAEQQAAQQEIADKRQLETGPLQASVLPQNPKYQEAQADLFGGETAKPLPEADAPSPALRKAELAQQIRTMEAALEDQRAAAAEAKDIDEAVAAGGRFKAIEAALAEARKEHSTIVVEASPEEKLARAYSSLQVAKEKGDVDGILRAAERIKELQAAGAASPSTIDGTQGAIPLKKFENKTESTDSFNQRVIGPEMAAGREAAAAQRKKVEDEIAGVRGLGRENDLPYARDARQERQAQLEVDRMEADRLDTSRTDQARLFNDDADQNQSGSATRDALIRQLQEARRNKDRKTADITIEKLRALLGDRKAQVRGVTPAEEMAPELAGTRMPETLPKAADEGQVDTTYTTRDRTGEDLRRQMQALPQQDAQTEALLDRLTKNLPAVAVQPERRAMVADWLHGLRTERATRPVADSGVADNFRSRDIASMLDTLEQGKASDAQGQPVQRDMFPQEQYQGKVFPTPQAFEKFLGSETLHKMRLKMGHLVETLARTAKRLAPIQKRIALLESNMQAEQEKYERSVGQWGEMRAEAEAAHAAAQARFKAVGDRLDEELRPLQVAYLEAQLALKEATDYSRDLTQSIVANKAQMGAIHAETATAMTDMLKAKQRLSELLHGEATKANYDEARAAQREVQRLNDVLALRREQLAPAVENFLKKDRAYSERLGREIDTIGKLHADMTSAKADLDRVAANQQRRVTVKRERAQAADEVRRTETNIEATKNAGTKDLQDISARIGSIEADINDLRNKAAGIERPFRGSPERERKAQPGETQRDREDADAAQRRQENEIRENLQNLPGTSVSFEKRQKMRGELDDHLADVKKYQAIIDSETSSPDEVKSATSSRDRAKAAAKLLQDAMASDGEGATKAIQNLNKRIEELQALIKKNVEKKAKAKTAKARNTAQDAITKYTKDMQRLEDLRSKKRGIEKEAIVPKDEREFTDAMERRPDADPKAREKAREEIRKIEADLENVTDPGTRRSLIKQRDELSLVASGRLPARKISVAMKKAVQAGDTRTGTAESKAGKNKVTNRNPITEVGRARSVTSKQAVKEGNKASNARAEAEILAEEVESNRRNEEAEKDRAAAAEARKNKQAAEAEIDIDDIDDVGMFAAEQRQRWEDLAGMDYDEVASKPSADRDSTPLASTTETKVRANDTAGVLEDLAKNASTPELRELAGKLSQLELGTQLQVAGKVTVGGESVAAKYDPKDDTATFHPEGLTEEDVLHELTHAATDGVLAADPASLTPGQLAGRKVVEGMHAALAKRGDMLGEHAISSPREFAAEVMTNKALRDKMDNIGGENSLLKRFINAVLRMIQMAPSQRAVRAIENIMRTSKKQDASATATPSIFRSKKTDFGPYADTPLGKMNLEKEDTRGFKEKYMDNAALEAEFRLADMHVYAVEAMRRSGLDTGKQAEFDIRAMGNVSSLIGAYVHDGAPEVFTDEKGYKEIRATDKDSIGDFFKAVGDIPVKDAQAKYDMLTNYMAALRGMRLGPHKVGTDMTFDQLKAVVDQVRNDPALYKAMEAARAKYNAYNNKLVKMAVDSGALTAEEGKQMTEHGDYVPLYRSRDGKLEAVLPDGTYTSMGDISHTPFMHKLEGGENRFLPLNETVFMNARLLTEMALTNQAKMNIGKTLAEAGATYKNGGVKEGMGEKGKDVLTWKEAGVPKHIIVDTDNSKLSGIPTAVLVQSINGFHATMPSMLRWAQKANDLLRAGVTRLPAYTVRQLLRDPMSAAAIVGIKGGPLAAVARAFKIYGQVMVNNKTSIREVEKRGLIHNNLMTGDPDDMQALARQMSGGDAPGAIRKFLNFMDKSAHAADAATRAQIWDTAKKRGLSDVEAAHLVRESMNFHKRGIDGNIQIANRALIFFNSGIQGLNAAQLALRGKMSFEDQLKHRQRFINNALMLALGGALYSAYMNDDDDYAKLKATDKIGKIHFKMPDGTMVALPVSFFETGGAAWALGQSILAEMENTASTAQLAEAFGRYAATAIPGGGGFPMIPGFKQVLEWTTNKDLRTFNDIVPRSLQNRTPGEQFTNDTPTALRAIGQATNVSPIKLQHALDSLLGTALSESLTLMDQVAPVVGEEKSELPTARIPFLKGLMQNPDSSEAADEVYSKLGDAKAAKDTFNAMKSEGRSGDEIRAYMNVHRSDILMAPMLEKFSAAMAQFKKVIGQIERMPAERMSAEAKAERIAELKKQRADVAEKYNAALKKLEERVGAA